MMYQTVGRAKARSAVPAAVAESQARFALPELRSIGEKSMSGVAKSDCVAKHILH
jgi:hypothetical protein